MRTTTLSLFLVTLLTAAPASAATVTVTSDADAGAGTLREAIETTAMANDTIDFDAGVTSITVTSELVIDKNLTISGPGAGSLAISGGGTTRVFTIDSGVTATITGVTVTSGSAVTGGGILNEGTLSMGDCVITMNDAVTGGGMFIDPAAGATTLTDCTVSSNTAEDGAGIANGTFAGTGPTLTLDGCAVTGNVASGGDPFATNQGGGVLNYGTLLVTGSSLLTSTAASMITGNTAGIGGGIYSAFSGVLGAPTLTVTGATVIASNTANLAGGGGIFNAGVGEVLAGSVIGGASGAAANDAPGGGPFDEGEGGGVLTIGPFTLTDSTVSNNTANNGGGVRSSDTLTVSGSTISDNAATNPDPSVDSQGGGIFSDADVVISALSMVTGNSADFGGGLLTEDHRATVDITDTTISDNTAITGAGIAAGSGLDGGPTVTVTTSMIIDNTASLGDPLALNTSAGGGILSFGQLTVSLSEISGNRAGDGGGVLNGESLLQVCSTSLDPCESSGDCPASESCAVLPSVAMIVDSSLSDNTAGVGGGLLNRSTATVAGSTFDGNHADLGGGLFNDSNRLATVFNSTFSFNRAGSETRCGGDDTVLCNKASPDCDDPGGGCVAAINPNSGASILNDGGTVRISNVTANGGSIASDPSGLFLVTNSVLTGSPNGENCGGFDTDVSDNLTITSEGYNIDSGTSCGFGAGVIAAGDLESMSPLIGALGSNGGPTLTHALQSGSPAIDAGHPAPPAPPGTAGNACADTDQTGLARSPAGDPRCDMGAVESVCGNGVVDGGEDCDDANAACGDGCDPNCKFPACGNGFICGADAETCDDGNTADSDMCDSSGTCLVVDFTVALLIGDPCTIDADCGLISGDCAICDTAPPFCGDGITQAGEECDDGGGNGTGANQCRDGSGVTPGCVDAACGDGIVDSGEECDDSNLANGDGCTFDCVLEFCGDGVTNNGGQEECDDGNAVDDDACSNDCALLVCGDGLLNGAEECDDGNEIGGDGCSATCTTEACGNGNIDVGEECDDGNLVDDDGCDSNCTTTACGNGIVTTGEDCDDGNTDGGDYCAADCLGAAGFCGDSIIQNGPDLCESGPSTGLPCGAASDCGGFPCGPGLENCDDGNATNGDGCDAACRDEFCGDGLVNDTSEVCDDGNTDSGDYCESDCSAVTGRCGDGAQQTNEGCDDGNLIDDDGCDSNCTPTGCGNGIVTSGETCDDGNLDNGDYCSDDCTTVTGFCGDGVRQSNEECDDGNSTNDDGCDDDVPAGEVCKATACGNGITAGSEVCDDGEDNGRGYCETDCSAIVGACGDGVVQPAEETCDDGNTSDGDSCEGNCQLPFCGDGKVNATVGETCDDGDGDINDPCPDGPEGTCLDATCGDLFLCDDGACTTGAGGPEDCDEGGIESATCDTDCTAPECGDGTLNMSAGETCDDGGTAPDDGCSANCGNEALQDRDQQKCIVAMNKAGRKVVKAQIKENNNCVREGLKGEFTDAQLCLTDDDRGKVQRAKDKTVATEAGKCPVTPGFAFTGAATTNQAAQDGPIAVVASLFGPDLDESIITEKSDPVAHDCQTQVIKLANKLLDLRVKSFLTCKKKKLKTDGSIISAAALGDACFGELAADEKQKAAKTVGKLVRVRERGCPAVDLDATFPGECVGTTGTDFDECVGAQVDCRMCQMLNDIDLLAGDCDQFAAVLPGQVCPL